MVGERIQCRDVLIGGEEVDCSQLGGRTNGNY